MICFFIILQCIRFCILNFSYHVYGIWVQRGGRCRVQNNRLGTRKTACSHNKQSCAVQRTVSDADFDNHNVFYRNADGNAHVAYVRTVFDGADTRRNRFYVFVNVYIIKNRFKRCAFVVHA